MASPRRRVDARQRKNQKKGENRDNVTAMKALAGVVVGLVILGVMISLGSGEDESLDNSKRSDPADNDPYAGVYEEGDSTPFRVEEGEESEVPQKRAQELILAIATQDQGKLDQIISWPLLFKKLADDNAWESERRWENLDDAARDTLKTEWSFQLFDEDLSASIKAELEKDILAGAAPPERNRVNDRSGVVTYHAAQGGRTLVVFHVTSYMLDGYTPENDYHSDQAWKIVKVAFDVKRAIGNKKKTKSRADIGADLGKSKKKRRKKRRRFTGPVEAEPGPVAWVEGTTEATKSKVAGLIKEAMSDSGRKSLAAQQDLVKLGKPAIPGLLNQIAATDLTARSEMRNVLFLVNTIEEITGEIRGVTGSVRLGGLAPPAPDAIQKGLRRWFGWWTNFGSSWVKEEYDPSKETWEQFEEDADEAGN